jgi:hypothetical protein
MIQDRVGEPHFRYGVLIYMQCIVQFLKLYFHDILGMLVGYLVSFSVLHYLRCGDWFIIPDSLFVFAMLYCISLFCVNV